MIKKVSFIITLLFIVLPAFVYGQTLPSVAGVQFGSNFSTCKRVLLERFGAPSFSSKDRIEFEHVQVGGLKYDIARFDFQYAQGEYKLSEVKLESKFHSYTPAENDYKKIKEVYEKNMNLTTTIILLMD